MTHRDYAMSFLFIARKRNIMRKLDFKNVFGYQEVKDELNRIISWYEDESLLNNPKVTLVKGILFYGDPGNGKTLLVREFLNNFDVPKFIIEGRNDNTSLEIKRVFEKAKKEKFAIVVIDELELLVPENSKEQRVLQQELDGVVQKGTVLVLATANNIYRVGSPLKRPGRFDKKIKIDKPARESRKEIFKGYLLELGIDINNINLDHVAKHCSDVSCASIKAICNDVYLRCQNSPITEEEIEKSYERVENNDLGKTPNTAGDYTIAIHEGGHSLLTLHFKDNWSFYKAKFVLNGGKTEVEEVKEHIFSRKKKEQDIMIGLGGYVAEKLILGYHDVGSENDLENAHRACRSLIEESCLYDLKYHITAAKGEREDQRHSEHMNEKIERLTYKVLKRFERKVYRFLKKHKKELIRFANYMIENKYVGYRDIEKIGLSNI